MDTAWQKAKIDSKSYDITPLEKQLDDTGYGIGFGFRIKSTDNKPGCISVHFPETTIALWQATDKAYTDLAQLNYMLSAFSRLIIGNYVIEQAVESVTKLYPETFKLVVMSDNIQQTIKPGVVYLEGAESQWALIKKHLLGGHENAEAIQKYILKNANEYRTYSITVDPDELDYPPGHIPLEELQEHLFLPDTLARSNFYEMVEQGYLKPELKTDTTVITVSIARNVVQSLSYSNTGTGVKSAKPAAKPKPVAYVDHSIIAGYENRQSGSYDYTKLIGLLHDLNYNFAAERPYTVAVLVRAVLDHTPPLFGYATFEQVRSNYAFPRTEKKYVEMLNNIRPAADDILHRAITKSKEIIDMSDIPPKIALNKYLQHCYDNEVQFRPQSPQQAKLQPKQQGSQGMKISLLTNSLKWDNYQHGLGFAAHIEIDNVDGDTDYIIDAWVSADDDHRQPWRTTGIHFAHAKAEPRRLKVEKGELIDLHVFLLHRIGMGIRTPRPGFDTDSVFLNFKLRKGSDISIKIKPAWLE